MSCEKTQKQRKFSTEVLFADTTSAEKLTISIDTSVSFPLNANLIGFNTAFTFGSGIENSPELRGLAADLHTRVLRFPGGTVANFYHPDGPGYGFIPKEMASIRAFTGLLKYQEKVQENILVPFSQLANDLSAKVIVVANLVTGTPGETVRLLDELAARKVNIIAVELGNELYFQRYRNYFPTVEEYIGIAKDHAAAIKEKYPALPLLVCAPGKMEDGSQGHQPAFFEQWNKRLSEEKFFSGYAIHTYFIVKKCLEPLRKDADNGFSCFYDQLQNDVPGQISSLTTYMQSIYGKDRQLWITEWNINPPAQWSNTFAHGAVVSQMLMAMADDPAIKGAAYHNFASSNDNYAIAYNLKGKGKGDVNITAAYKAFLPYARLSKAGAKRVAVESNEEQAPHITAWKTPGGRIFLWYVNPWNKKFDLSLRGVSFKNAIISSVAAENFTSPNNEATLSSSESRVNVRNLPLQPFSWGLIELL